MPSATPEVVEETVTRHMPMYRVLLHDDDHHSYEYVIALAIKIFGMGAEAGMALAQAVDGEGKGSCGVFSLEVAELKQEQIHSLGPDPLIEASAGPMTASIEPE